MEKSDEQETKANNQTGQPKNEFSPTIPTESGLPPSVPPTPQCHNKSDNNSNPRKSEPPNWCEKSTLVLEVFGIIGLAVYCFYTIKEWGTFDSERVTMEAESKMFEKQAHTDQRAWIAPLAMDSGYHNSGYFRINYKNTGKTPALNVFGVITNAVSTQTIPRADEMPAIRENALLPPEGTQFLEANGISPPRIQAMQQGTPIYVYGTIWYDDIFGNHHWTRFGFAVTSIDGMPTDLQFTGIPGRNSCDDAQTNQRP
jgi:hypothetical protein